VRVAGINLRSRYFGRRRSGTIRENDRRLATVAANRQAENFGGGDDSGQRARTFDHLAMEIPLLRFLRILVARQAIFERQEIIGIEAGIDAGEAGEAARAPDTSSVSNEGSVLGRPAHSRVTPFPVGWGHDGVKERRGLEGS
jgi:hypothetical protein